MDESDFEGYESTVSSMPFVSIRQKDLKDGNGRLKSAAGGFRISYPLFKDIETSDVQTLTVTILSDRRTRVYFETLDDKQPKCKSTDAITGVGIPGGSCHQCPLGQFVSGQSPKCKNGFTILAWDHVGGYPYIIQLGPSGLRSYNQFRKLAEQKQRIEKLPLHGMVIKVSTAYVREPAEHYIPVFELLRTTTSDEFRDLKAFRNAERLARMNEAAVAPTIIDVEVETVSTSRPADRQSDSDLPF